jgi:hypothetical protein
MKKLLVLAAAAFTASVVGVSAQTYSANVVGYINVTCTPGFTMIANQLNNTNNTVGAVFPQTLPADVQLWTWTGLTFLQNTWYGDSWDDDSINFGPGTGGFIKNPYDTNVVITFVGEVLQGNLNITNNSGFNLIGSIVPTAGNLETTMALTNGNGISYDDQVWTWTGLTYAQNTYYGDGDWDADPIVQVGQGFFVKHTGGTTIWQRYFTVQ